MIETCQRTFASTGLDTRASKVDSSGTRSYRRDGAYVTDPVLSDGTLTFTPGISTRSGSNSRFQHSDRLGSNSRQTNASEGVSSNVRWDAFGMQASSSGTHSGPFGFAGAWGYQQDSDSGVMLLGHRYYDPSTGRFLTRDPIKDGRNWYGYCENNPLVNTDASGLFTSLHNPRSAALIVELAEEGVIAGGGAVGGGGGGLGGVLKVWGAIAAIFGIAVDLPPSSGPPSRTGPKPRREKPIPVYRVGAPGGRYWSREDPRGNAGWFDDYGMRHDDNPGDTISGVYVLPRDQGTGWIEGPTTDYSGRPIGNGKTQIVVVGNPFDVIKGSWSHSRPPGFFK